MSGRFVTDKRLINATAIILAFHFRGHSFYTMISILRKICLTFIFKHFITIIKGNNVLILKLGFIVATCIKAVRIPVLKFYKIRQLFSLSLFAFKYGGLFYLKIITNHNLSVTCHFNFKNKDFKSLLEQCHELYCKKILSVSWLTCIINKFTVYLLLRISILIL